MLDKIRLLLLIFPLALSASKENTHANITGQAVPREYVLFESDPVRPLAISHDGAFLFVTNIPDSHVEVYSITPFGLSFYQSIPVGLEPVALAITADDKELWVVNHLSDSISVIDLSKYPFYVKQTLLVGDEPRDIVFAGTSENRAFITTAHRGQNLDFDPQLYTPGTPRADVWVFQHHLTAKAEFINVVSLFGDTPRALTVSNDKSTVYAAIYKSGNKTTTLPPGSISSITKPPPLISADGVPQPHTGLIVRFNGLHWVDELERIYDDIVSFSLPDFDVFGIDANATVPSETKRTPSVGSVLFNMAVNPANGDLLISNLESRNHIRFEGRALSARTTVRGHIADNQISIVDELGVRKIHLNPHLDFSKETGDENDRELSLSLPMSIQFNNDGSEFYLAAFGSDKIARFNYQSFKQNSLPLDKTQQLTVSGGGPAGLVYDTKNNRLYVYTRYDNGISIIDLEGFSELGHILMPNPEPDSVIQGRPFLYNAGITSGFGNDSCASCHIFADNDSLAWDLGNPDDVVRPIPNSYHPLTALSPFLSFQFHPMKGPMTTQSMRGLVRHGPQHWRGDRTGSSALADESLEEAAFKEFNGAFDALLAKPSGLNEVDLQKFTDFAMQLTYPPNPNRAIDNSLTGDQQAGKNMYDFGVLRANGNLEVCSACHPIDPANGIYGTTGQMSDNAQPGERDFKIPHFRDQYQKIGMFTTTPGFKQNQIRGFAFNHNGATSNNALFSEFGISSDKVRQLKSFLYAFPTETAPIVGQQLTVDKSNYSEVTNRLSTLILRAQINFPIPECDLTAFQFDSKLKQWLYDRHRNQFIEDDGISSMSQQQFKSLLAQTEKPVTLTCQPWGSGERIALDRDRDEIYNQLETIQGSSDIDSNSTSFRPQTGLWHQPEKPGSGLDIEISGNNLVVVWYTHRENKTPVWYLASAPISPSWQADLMEFHWAPSTGTTEAQKVGSIQLLFENNKVADFSWSLESHQGNDTIQYFQFSSEPAALKLTGLWYDPNESGWGLSLITQGHNRVAVTYYYNSDLQPQWSISNMENNIETSIATVYVSGSCPWCDYEEPATNNNGSISLEFVGLNQANLQLEQLNIEDPNEIIWQRQIDNLQRFTDIME